MHEEKLIELKGEINKSTTIVMDFRSCFSATDRTTRPKVTNDIENLDNIIDQRIKWTYTEHFTQKQQNTFLLNAYGTFAKIGYIMSHVKQINKI